MADFWITACGCWHEAWNDNFYPDDIPLSWRFSYFSNEFSAIYLTHEQWCQAALEDVSAWMEDCSEHFQFLLQIDLRKALDEQAQQRIAVLAEQVAAVVFFGSGADIEARQRDIVALLPAAQIFYDVTDAQGPQVSTVQHVDDAASALSANFIIVDFTPAPKLLATWLSTLLSRQQSAALVFCGAKPSVESIRQAEGLLPFLLASPATPE